MPRQFWPACLLMLLPLAAVPTASGKVRSDWSKVQSVPPGMRMNVQLYKNAAPKGDRKIVGQFASASTGSLTLMTPDGASRTLERSIVQKIRIRRPIGKRLWGWIAWAVGAGIWNAYLLHPDADLTAFGVLIWSAPVTAPAPLLLHFSRTRTIYEVPPTDRGP